MSLWDDVRRLHLEKKRNVQVTVGIALLIIIVCIVGMIIPNKQYVYENTYFVTAGEASGDTVVIENIALPIGIYQVELLYDVEKDWQGFCNLQDGTVYSGALRSNGEHLYAGKNATSFQIWLYEPTDGMQLILSYNGAGSLELGNLIFYETDKIWTLLLTVTLFLAVLALGFMGFAAYDREYTVDRGKKNAFFLVTVIALAASIPYLLGRQLSGADLTYHLQRIEGVKDGLLSGQFPIRLEPEWVHGYGYANAIFYCNGLLLFPAILRLLGFTVMGSYQIFIVGMNFLTAGIAYFCFSRIFKDRYIGVVCSALYTLSIFRIYKLVITSAMGEGTAFTFLPLILYGLYQALTMDVTDKKYKKSWIFIMLGYAGLLQTHVLTCEITAFLTILICIVAWKRIFRKETFLELAKGALGALLLSFWYLVPFLQYYLTEDVRIKHVSGRTIQDRGLYPAQLAFHYWPLGSNALLGEEGMQYSHALGIGFVLVIAFCTFVILWFSGKINLREKRLVTLGKVSAVFGGLLMLMSLNIFPWDQIQNINGITASLVSSLQFPNRFLGWGTVFLVAVAGCCLKYFQEHHKNWMYVGVVVALIGVTTSSLYLTDHVCRDMEFYQLYSEESMGFGYISGEEYLLHGTDASLLVYGTPIAGKEVSVEDYEKHYLQATMYCENQGETESYIEVPMLYYTGYQAKVMDTGERLEVCAGDNNVVRVILPAGFSGTLQVGFVSPIHWRAAEAVTYLFWLFLIVLCVRSYRKRKISGGQRG